MTEHVVWSGMDALYDRAMRASEALLIGIGILTGMITIDQQGQLTQEPPQRGEE